MDGWEVDPYTLTLCRQESGVCSITDNSDIAGIKAKGSPLAMADDVLGCDGHFDVSSLFELHFIATLIR